MLVAPLPLPSSLSQFLGRMLSDQYLKLGHRSALSQGTLTTYYGYDSQPRLELELHLPCMFRPFQDVLPASQSSISLRIQAIICTSKHPGLPTTTEAHTGLSEKQMTIIELSFSAPALSSIIFCSASPTPSNIIEARTYMQTRSTFNTRAKSQSIGSPETPAARNLVEQELSNDNPSTQRIPRALLRRWSLPGAGALLVASRIPNTHSLSLHSPGSRDIPERFALLAPSARRYTLRTDTQQTNIVPSSLYRLWSLHLGPFQAPKRTITFILESRTVVETRCIVAWVVTSAFPDGETGGARGGQSLAGTPTNAKAELEFKLYSILDEGDKMKTTQPFS
ncbi:hypothetical protein FB451DRAFT_1178984 [Mycena latifolia]|nr:hypothetical protein FB451DRAFT_1178984 [Mycena latifolia]